jgi:hypothetical protein
MWYCRETSQILRSHRRRTYSFESRPPDSAAPAIFLSLPVLKNPRDLLSGDQNGKEAPSVPANACGKSSSSGRTQSTSLPAHLALRTLVAVHSARSRASRVWRTALGFFRAERTTSFGRRYHSTATGRDCVLFAKEGRRRHHACSCFSPLSSFGLIRENS